MTEVCPKCGLPKDLCVCGEIAKEAQKIVVNVSKKKFGKLMTTISGFDGSVDLKALSKELKKKLACGGTVKDGEIELQGDHKARVKESLLEMGYSESQINIR